MASSPVELSSSMPVLAEPDWPERFGEMLPVSLAARAAGPRAAFTEQDIDRWSWDDQAITLSRRRDGRLVALLPRDSSSPIPPER